MMNGMGWGMGWGMGFGGILWLLIIGLVIWAIQAATKNRPAHNSTAQQEENALEILKKRYARGEISDEEFAEKRKHLLQ